MLRQAAIAKVLMSENPGDVFAVNSVTKRPSPGQSISVKGVVVYLAAIVALALFAILLLSLLNTV